MPKAVRTLPPADYLHQHFEHDPVTGAFRSRRTGRAIGWLSPKGYLQVRIGDHKFYVARVIWKMHHGVDPEWIDHKDGDRLNNRLENLRSVTMLQNNRNMLKRPGMSGYIGAFVRKGRWIGKPFRATIRGKNGKKQYLGVFDTAEEAHAAYVAAANEIFGEHSPFKRR